MYGLLQKKSEHQKLPHSPIERMVSGIFFFFLLFFRKKEKKIKFKKWLLPG